jgi:hypothetical protein
MTRISRALLFMGCALTLTAAERTVAIDAVREYALNYTKRLPNYTCTLTTRQTTRPANAINDPSIQVTVTEEELSFVDNKEIRRITRIDGRPVSQQGDDQPAGMSRGEFGNLLDIIFEPATGADVRWNRAATLNSRKVDVLAFHVPQARGYLFKRSGGRGDIRVPFEGFVYADAQTHEVLRIQMKCTMIPDNSEIRAFELTLDYRSTQVAGHEFVMPFNFALHYMNSVEDRQHTNEGRYSACRQFSADATIQFEGDKR